MDSPCASIRNAFVKGWTSWHSTRLGSNLRDEEAKLRLPVDIAIIMTEAHKKSQSGEIAAIAGSWVEKSLISLIYGSNVIETAGSNLRITTQLCQDIFRGKPVEAYIDERDPDYQEHLENLAETHRKSDITNVIRSRMEIIGHANALHFIIDHIILNNEAWSEELILQTHRILYEGIDDDVTPGKYRTHEVTVCYSNPGDKHKKKRSLCMRATAVPRYMKEMIENLNNEIIQAEYAGHVAPFGGEGNDKDNYLAIVRRGGVIFHREDMGVDFSQQTSHFGFAKFVLTKSKSDLEQMWAWANPEQKA